LDEYEVCERENTHLRGEVYFIVNDEYPSVIHDSFAPRSLPPYTQSDSVEDSCTNLNICIESLDADNDRLEKFIENPL